MAKKFKINPPTFRSSTPTRWPILQLLVVSISLFFTFWTVPQVAGNFYTPVSEQSSSSAMMLIAFGTVGNEDFVYLPCPSDNKTCICGEVIMMDPWDFPDPDPLSWPLTWDSQNKSCRMGKGGPCVPYTMDTGLSLGYWGCELGSGLECIQDRCRSPKNLHQTPVNHKCQGHIDCAQGLECVQRGNEEGGPVFMIDSETQSQYYTSKYCRPLRRTVDFFSRMEPFRRRHDVYLENMLRGCLDEALTSVKIAIFIMTVAVAVLFFMCISRC